MAVWAVWVKRGVGVPRGAPNPLIFHYVTHGKSRGFRTHFVSNPRCAGLLTKCLILTYAYRARRTGYREGRAIIERLHS